MYQIHSLFLKTLFFVVVVLIVAGLKIYAQSSNRIDSLKVKITQVDGVQRFDATYELGLEYYYQNDLASSIEQFKAAQSLALKVGDSLRIVKSIRVKSQMLFRLGQTDQAFEELFWILRIARRQGFKDEQEKIVNLLAIAYTYQANYDKALEYHFENLDLREEKGDHADIRSSLNNIGIVYFKLRNYPKALEYYLLALDHDRKVEESDFKDQLLINTALCYNQLKKYDEAREFITRAIEFCSPNCNQNTILHGEFGLGVSYYGQNNLKEAKTHFEKSLQIAQKVENIRFQAENLIYLAHIFAKILNYDSALVALDATEAIATENGFNELLIEAFKEYSSLYSKQRDFERASFYQQKYITLKDSIYSGQLIDRIAKIQTEYQERVNLQTIASKDETIARQRAFTILVAIIAVLAGALIFVLYQSIKVKRKVNADLSDAKAIIEDQNRQLRSSNVHLNMELKEKNVELQKANDSLHRVNDELDNFIYKTSHDIRGPLASLKGMCNVALMDVKDPLALNYLQKLDITAEKLNTILTRLLIVNQINNSSIGQERIDFDAIVDEILLLERKKGMPKRLKISKSICPKTVFHSDPQFVRIILENLIDNAIKFYNDSERVEPFVNISIGDDGEHVSINVVDNGIGISEVHPDKIFQMFSRASERSETGGIGLYITKTASEKLGGTVHLKTTPEGYTEFYVKLPYSYNRIVA